MSNATTCVSHSFAVSELQFPNTKDIKIQQVPADGECKLTTLQEFRNWVHTHADATWLDHLALLLSWGFSQKGSVCAALAEVGGTLFVATNHTFVDEATLKEKIGGSKKLKAEVQEFHQKLQSNKQAQLWTDTDVQHALQFLPPYFRSQHFAESLQQDVVEQMPDAPGTNGVDILLKSLRNVAHHSLNVPPGVMRGATALVELVCPIVSFCCKQDLWDATAALRRAVLKFAVVAAVVHYLRHHHILWQQHNINPIDAYFQLGYVSGQLMQAYHQARSSLPPFVINLIDNVENLASLNICYVQCTQPPNQPPYHCEIVLHKVIMGMKNATLQTPAQLANENIPAIRDIPFYIGKPLCADCAVYFLSHVSQLERPQLRWYCTSHFSKKQLRLSCDSINTALGAHDRCNDPSDVDDS